MVVTRLPHMAERALRSQIDGFLRDCRQLDDPSALDANLSAFLLAALRYTRDEHPWLGREGAVVDPSGDDPPDVGFALDDALATDAGHSVDSCLQALQKVAPFVVSEEPCGHRRPSPRSYPWWPGVPGDLAGASTSVGVVASPGWIRDESRRDGVFRSLLGDNHEPLSFVPLRPHTATTLAHALLCDTRRAADLSVAPGTAERFVRLFGGASCVFAPRGLDPAHPFAAGVSCSQYDQHGRGSWGRTASLLVSDGWRVAFIEVLWDVSSE